MTVPSWLLLVMAALTAARLVRLITRDVFPPIQWARDRIVDKAPESWVAHLVTCVWCASFYVSAWVVALLWLAPGVATPVLMTGAVWALSATLAWWQGRVEDADEQEQRELEPEAEDEMATMVTLERQDTPNGRVDA